MYSVGTGALHPWDPGPVRTHTRVGVVCVDPSIWTHRGVPTVLWRVPNITRESWAGCYPCRVARGS